MTETGMHVCNIFEIDFAYSQGKLTHNCWTISNKSEHCAWVIASVITRKERHWKKEIIFADPFI